MAAPGWYPDPESMSRERFWDGDAWTVQVREAGTQVRPAMPGLGGPSDQPGQPGQQGQQGQPGQQGRTGDDAETIVGQQPFSPFNPSVPLRDLEALDAQDRLEAQERTRLPGQPPRGGPPAPRARYVAPGTPAAPERERRTGLLVGLLVLAVVVVGGGLAAVLLLSGGEDESADPTTDPTTPATPSESPQLAGLCSSGDSDAEETAPDDGRVHGGGLSFEAPPGYTENDNIAFGYTFTTAPSAVAAPVAGSYASTYAVGTLDRSDFGTPEQAAASVVECYASGRFYDDPLPTYVPGDDEELTVDGRPAVSAGGELQLLDAAIPGGDLQVIVVDTEDPETYGLFVGDQVLDDAAQLREREEVVAGLQVD